MILNDLKKQLPESLLIEDTFQHKGRPLFISYIRLYLENGYKIFYFNFDSHPLSDKNELEKLKFKPLDAVGMEMNFLKKSNIQTSENDCNVIVAIDSLTPLLFNQNLGNILSTVKSVIKPKQCSVVALVHGDAHDKDILSALAHSFSCHLKLTVKFSNSEHRKICNGVLKKRSGKIVDSNEYYTVTDNWEIRDVIEVSDAKVSVSASPSNCTPSSTFKLGLNLNEEVARSQVILPYIRKQSASSTGQIIYEVESPDWEDEDPDDDLEI